MRAHSAEWENLREALDAAKDKLVEQRNAVPDVMTGQFANGVDKSLNQLIEYIGSLRDSVDTMRKDLKNGAAELQEAKIMIVIQLALLAIQLAWLISSLFGALAIPAVVAGFRAIITAILRQVFIEVLQELAEEPLLMMVIQAAQDADGVREGIDWDAAAARVLENFAATGQWFL